MNGAVSSARPAAAERQARFWNRFARRYAAHRMGDPQGYERSLERVRELLGPQSALSDVLEIGCGTGSTALLLAPGVHRYLGTDVSEAMIGIAREKLLQQPIAGLQFEVTTAPDALAAPARWDAVIAFNVLHLIDDWQSQPVAICRALRPGGWLISKTPCVAELSPWVHRLAVPALRSIGLAPPMSPLRAEQLAAALAEAGLEVLPIERHGTRGRDVRAFIAARKPLASTPETA